MLLKNNNINRERNVTNKKKIAIPPLTIQRKVALGKKKSAKVSQIARATDVILWFLAVIFRSAYFRIIPSTMENTAVAPIKNRKILIGFHEKRKDIRIKTLPNMKITNESIQMNRLKVGSFRISAAASDFAIPTQTL